MESYSSSTAIHYSLWVWGLVQCYRIQDKYIVFGKFSYDNISEEFQ